MKEILGKIFRQRNIGRHWGTFSLVISQVGIFTSALTLLLVSISAYVPTSEWFMGHGIYMRFWVFAIAIAVLLIIAFILAWKFLLPSFYSSWNDQFYRHDNPVKADLGEIKTDLDEVKKILTNDLGDIRGRLDKLEQSGEPPSKQGVVKQGHDLFV